MTMAIDIDTIAVELREKAKALKPVLRERAADTERTRTVPKASIDDCREAGFFKIIQCFHIGDIIILIICNIGGQLFFSY